MILVKAFMCDKGEPQGMVYLVGAGPGDPDLLTLAAVKVLQRADVVLYDRLVNASILEYAPTHAERIYVGKEPRRHALTQSEINALLVEQALQGKTVVRLKGGDPFVFGRGGEEAEACAAMGIRWRAIPGVSSALGVPTAAGIPLTHRDWASSFAVVTGHGADDFETGLDWSALARMDTLVILMGVEQLAAIVQVLYEHGKPFDTPVALIERGTTPDERVIVGSLGTIVEIGDAESVSPPAIIVVGDIVRVRQSGQIAQFVAHVT